MPLKTLPYVPEPTTDSLPGFRKYTESEVANSRGKFGFFFTRAAGAFCSFRSGGSLRGDSLGWWVDRFDTGSDCFSRAIVRALVGLALVAAISRRGGGSRILWERSGFTVGALDLKAK